MIGTGDFTEKALQAMEHGHKSEALQLFNQALVLSPANRIAAARASQLYLEQGLTSQANSIWRNWLAAEADITVKTAVFRALMLHPDPANDIVLSHHCPLFEQVLLELIASGYDRQVARSTAVYLINSLALTPAMTFDSNSDLLTQLAGNQLFTLFLRQTVNVSITMEQFLTRLRRHLLLLYSKSPCPAPLLPLLASLAHQCANNEYIFMEAPMESRALARLLEGSGWQNEEAKLLLLACYRNLAFPPETLNKRTFSEQTSLLLEKIFYQPQEEREIALTIESLGQIRDPTSSEVRGQYEENPYPRWLTLPPEGASLGLSFTSLPARPQLPEFLSGPFQVLVAGGGTGRHPLSLARDNPNARVLVLDLSRASLAYGKRMARSYKLENLSFLQGDILDMEGPGQSFHHIESVGVLHHMQDPEKGWETLRNRLYPGGTMRIGLYSQLARQTVAWVAELIRSQKLSPDPANLSRLRQELMQAPNGLVHGLNNVDFFSTSAFRDLVFHVMEHRFTIPRIQAALQKLRLQFLGFDLPTRIRFAYSQEYEDDPDQTNLENWHRFEQAHPQTFFGMYQFLVRARET